MTPEQEKELRAYFANEKTIDLQAWLAKRQVDLVVISSDLMLNRINSAQEFDKILTGG